MNGYQLRIDVEGCADPIWRRIKIPAIISFEDLHQLIQTLFGLKIIIYMNLGSRN